MPAQDYFTVRAYYDGPTRMLSFYWFGELVFVCTEQFAAYYGLFGPLDRAIQQAEWGGVSGFDQTTSLHQKMHRLPQLKRLH